MGMPPEVWQPARVAYLQERLRDSLGPDTQLATDLNGLETQWSAVSLSLQLTNGENPLHLPQTKEGIIEGLVQSYRKDYFEKTLLIQGLRFIEKHIPILGPIVGEKTDKWAVRRENIQRQRSITMYIHKGERRNH